MMNGNNNGNDGNNNNFPICTLYIAPIEQNVGYL